MPPRRGDDVEEVHHSDDQVEHRPEDPETTPEHEGSSLEELPDALHEDEDEDDRGAHDGRGRTVALGTVIVLAVVTAIIVGALTSGDDNAAPGAPGTPGEAVVEASSSVVPAAPAAGAPADGADVAPASLVVPVKDSATVGDFEVAFGRTDPDAVDEVEDGDGTYHDELSGDDVLVVATVTVRNVGDRPLDPAVDLLAGYLGADGREYDMLRGQFCMAEDSLYHVGNLAPGASVTGTVCQGMPAAAVDGGVWVLRPADDYGQVVHFAAR
ncbi:hypothetical protein [Georgenia halophila]|uniref:hypothetical protein n=1 Tax=Georgenia halophila TaxID=620889 RepID=UPI0031E584F7